MYLKQVELENFKSFGGKMTIPLMEGYMAVTGPNGSGKSNITDAILFVLGPKSSKAMRAGKLTDLIFNSDKGKGRAEYTKVSLVFDNTDRMLPWNDDVVKLTRHVKFASNGEDYTSNFYINDQRSTMSEFDSLLSRARISAEGYNLVQQGDVTRIVQMGSLERRRILDGISGIASYDADISKAEGERAEAQTNLDRIELIMGELDKQLEQLKADMEAAKLYMEAKNRLDIAKVQAVHRSLETEKTKIEMTNTNIAEAQEFIAAKRAEADSFRADILAATEEIKAVEAKIAESVGPEYNKVKKAIEDIRVQIATLSDAVERMSLENDELEEDIARENEELRDAESEFSTCVASIQENEIGASKLREELTAADEETKRIGEEMSSKGGEHQKLQTVLADLDSQVDAKTEEEAKLRAKAESLEQQYDAFIKSMATAEDDIKGAAFELKDAEWNLSEYKKDTNAKGVNEMTQSILAAKKKETELEKQESELRDVISRITEEYNRLSAEKKVTERMRGSDAVQKILELRDRGELKGIHGTIAELASVEPEYEVALSTAAGAKMQAIVVDNDQVAADAMEILKKTNAGRATFLPLNKMMDGKPRAKAIMVVKDTEGYAIDLVDFKEQYRAAFWYVFADTLVARTLDDARRIMGNVRIVTKTGELLEASGAMVGGTVKQSGLKFGAASQSKLDEVSAELRGANDSMAVLRSQLNEVRAHIRELDNEMRSNSASALEIQTCIAKLEVQIKEIRGKKTRLEEVYANMDTDHEKFKALRKEVAENYSKCSAELTELKDKRVAVRERIKEIAPVELQQRMEAARKAVYDITAEIDKLRDAHASLMTERSGIDNHIEALKRDLSANMKKLTVNKEGIVKNDGLIKEKTVELTATRKIEAEMEAGISDLRNERDAILARKMDSSAKLESVNDKIEVKNGLIESLRASLLISQSVVAQLNAEIEALNIDVVLPLPSEDEIKRTIKACENTINKLGTVNLRAIDDYAERKARFDTLMADTERLNMQIKDLTGLMDSLNAEKKGLFMKTYDGIDVNFRETYSQLSGGGEAFMKLEDEDDPFQGGLMINAKPKNGKLLRLEALSGGEKSLTALAFIFAIQEFQPSPFYVLDEVDMFLDSVNAEMVAKRVRESSAKAQFIQVSLRKVTLAMAEHLIGVARQPNGVSKVIIQPDLAEVSKYEEQAKASATEDAIQ